MEGRSRALHSFVVPAHGRSPHLEACLASLQAQTLRSPIVVATATPFADLHDVAAAYGARVVINADGGGIGRDWNFALAQASTPWVTLAHQDDVYLPEFASRSMALATASPDVALVLTGYAELLGSSTRSMSAMLLIKRALLELGFLGRRVARRRGARLRLLRFGCPVPCPSVTVRVDAGLPLFREDLRVNLDWDAWARLASADASFAYERDVLMLHRIHDASETSAGVREGVRAREDLMMFRRFWPAPVARVLARAYALSYQSGGDA